MTTAPPGSRLLGTGMAVPEHVVPNSWFAEHLDTSDEWIRTRTGIRERRFAERSERTSDYAVRAAGNALARAGVTAEEIGLVAVATTVPDMHMPATANFVARRMGIRNAYAYDVSAACSGFLFALAGADAQLRAGMVRGHALVVGAEIYSAILDMSDRSTCTLFGDGAGAAVFAPPDGRGGAGILRVYLDSRSEHTDVLDCRGGGTAYRSTNAPAGAALDTIRMDGPFVFRLAIEGCCRSIEQVLAAEKLTPADIARIVPHQANMRIIQKIAENFDYPLEKIEVDLDRYGNTAAASVPIALHEMLAAGRARPGELVLLVAAGAGFNSGAILLRL